MTICISLSRSRPDYLALLHDVRDLSLLDYGRLVTPYSLIFHLKVAKSRLGIARSGFGHVV
jgi:hypothetical protein